MCDQFFLVVLFVHISVYLYFVYLFFWFFFFKQKTAYEMRISDWSSDVCSSDLLFGALDRPRIFPAGHGLAERPGPFASFVDRKGRVDPKDQFDGLLCAGDNALEAPLLFCSASDDDGKARDFAVG